MKFHLLYTFSIILVFGVAAGSVAAEPTGEDLYYQTCSLCHGDDGTGAMPGIPNISGAGGPLWKPQEELLFAIMNGIERPDLPTPMPAKGGNDDMTIEMARDVLEFIRREFGKQP